jgi:hypothetical protein
MLILWDGVRATDLNCLPWLTVEIVHYFLFLVYLSD